MDASAPGRQIVLVTYGSPGDLRPFLAIGAELSARGHQVVVASAELYRQPVIAAGLGFAPVRPDRAPGQRDPDFFDRLRRNRQSPAAIFRHMFLPALRESLADLLCAARHVDAVVSHPLAAAARLAAEHHGIAWISTVMQPMGYLSSREPPLLGVPWFWAALRRLGPGATGPAMRAARAVTYGWTTEWRALRVELGLPPVPDHPLWEGQHSPLRSLGLFPHALGAPQADWPPQAVVTGYPFYRDPTRALDERLERFLAAGEPPVVFTLGTTAVNEPGSFFAESAAAAARLSFRAVLVGSREADAEGPDRLHVPYAPHELLFPRALAVVHQGGIGTLCEALQAGKPMLIMPYGHDQADNAWRAARLGAARLLPRRRYTARAVSRSLDRLLREPRYRLSAERASRDLTREQGAPCAADLIESAIAAHAATGGTRGETP
jgi:UDP:flavonoid glycosyltransferase YjiC (YdhE family)